VFLFYSRPILAVRTAVASVLHTMKPFPGGTRLYPAMLIATITYASDGFTKFLFLSFESRLVAFITFGSTLNKLFSFGRSAPSRYICTSIINPDNLTYTFRASCARVMSKGQSSRNTLIWLHSWNTFMTISHRWRTTSALTRRAPQYFFGESFLDKSLVEKRRAAESYAFSSLKKNM